MSAVRPRRPLAALRAAAQRVRGGSPDGDEGAALLTVVMLMFIVGALSVLVLGTVVSQVRPTAATQESSRTVFAAEAGVQTALSQIRTARSSNGSGDRLALPCSASGSVDGSGGLVTFTTTVDYYLSNPTGQDSTWLTANKLACSTPGGPNRTPSYAVVRAKGLDTTGGVLVTGRQLQAVYTFSIVNQNVPGGLMLSGQGVACLQADGATAGSTLRYVKASTCTSSKPLQQFVYDTGYHLVLASSITTTTSGGTSTTSGMCLTRGADGAAVQLQPCTLDSRSGPQLWTYTGGGLFQGQRDDNSDYGGMCLYSGQDGDPTGRQLITRDGCPGGNSDGAAFLPEAKVGAGAASLATSQIVNFLQFGRCTDVTYENVDESSMIVYPCKQDPSGRGRVFWNHKWFYGAETGVASEPSGAEGMATRIRVLQPNSDGTANEYCLTTPLSTAQPSYTVFRACDGSASQQYTRTYNTGDLASSYLFRTSDGRCLTLGPTRDAGITVSTIVAGSCDGSAAKWNAPPNAQDPKVTAQTEIKTSS